ncbi:ABC transporter ATP-binding protein [Micromonospora zingiberis]|uniref:ABC-type quaternary amine transporter n=1 Tax=Micromonospora zingiberis TaxID=2053011 RepID=A0A4R0GLC6_9ACTN|nr:ABC transporter ATP-binding protein [Micromonospora zingiberis]TCB96299.1 ABC transporter ATP-binding protein [Micromonospora zingiberis]
MSDVVLGGVVKHYGRVTALAGVDVSVPSGQLTAVLGPSGCGKTTLLRCLAGFERLDAGEIHIDGTRVAGGGRHLPAHRRNIAVVPQEGALFPHLSVADNVGYGLDRAARRSDRVEEVLALVGLAGYGGRMPHQLSGGQQQRVAVARALAPRPSVVLLDEPFSALDAGLRAGLRHDVREALRADGATGVLVTHDQGEALSVADKVVVLRDGRVVQAAAPTTVYREPADAWVAGFVGDAVLLPAVVEQGAARTALGVVPVTGVVADGPVTVLVRPEQVRFAAGPDAVTATVLRHDFHGHDALVGLRLADGTRITARILDGGAAVPLGGEVTVQLDGAARAFPAQAGPDLATSPLVDLTA